MRHFKPFVVGTVVFGLVSGLTHGDSEHESHAAPAEHAPVYPVGDYAARSAVNSTTLNTVWTTYVIR